MTQVFHSGAFVQQCFSVHPLCLSLKRFEDQIKLVFSCSSCRMAHHITVDSVSARVAIVVDQPDDSLRSAPEAAAGVLANCIVEHAGAVTIREMDVLQDAIGLRCAQCRRVFDLRTAAIETRQK